MNGTIIVNLDAPGLRFDDLLAHWRGRLWRYRVCRCKVRDHVHMREFRR